MKPISIGHFITYVTIVIFANVILFSSGASVSCGAEKTKTDLYAVIVAVSKYKRKDYALPHIQEARELKDFLVERSDLFANTNIAFLENEKATRDNVLTAIKVGLKKASKDDVVIIYLDGHGQRDPSNTERYYFSTYEAGTGPLEKTAVCVNDGALLSEIKSERLLLLSGSCFSGGFLSSLGRSRGTPQPEAFFSNIQGRFGISSSDSDETSTSYGYMGMTYFGFYLIKGLRGGADVSRDGIIGVKELYDYVSDNVIRHTNGGQHPRMFAALGNPEKTPIYSAPKYDKKLKIDVKCFYENDEKKLQLLTEGTELKSGAKVGIVFKPESDCHVHILWWDSNGNVGRLFPNPELTEGSGFVKAGQEIWLPSKGGAKYAYMLDKNPGIETIYIAASRERNQKLEALYEELIGAKARGKPEDAQKKVALKLEREVNMMGFAEYTVPYGSKTQSYADKKTFAKKIESKIQISGADASFKLTFKHVNP